MAIAEKELNEYMLGLANAAGIPEADRPAFLAKDEVKKFAHTSLEAVEREKGRANKATSEAQRVYEENLKIAASNQQVVDAATKKVQAYVEKFGELPGGGDPDDPNARRTAVSDAIDKKTFDERIKTTETNTLGLFTTGLKLLDRFRREFPDQEFKTDEILKLATEQGLTADKAFDEWVKPMRDERTKAANEAALKKAREEGEIEGRSKVAASTVSDPDRSSPFMANLRKSGQVQEGPRESFIKAWREAEQPKRGGTA